MKSVVSEQFSHEFAFDSKAF